MMRYPDPEVGPFSQSPSLSFAKILFAFDFMPPVVFAKLYALVA